MNNSKAADGIRMNNVLPGFIDSLPETEERRLRIPMGRYGTVDEIAKTVRFLLSADAGYITGQNIRVDGGLTRSVYSPDGSQIAVSYWQDGHWEIHTLNADGSNRQRLTSTPYSVLVENTQLVSEYVAGAERFVAPEKPHWNNAAPVWSADGTQIAFLTDRTGQWEIWIMAADGSNQRPMFPNGALDDLTLSYACVDERMLSW